MKHITINCCLAAWAAANCASHRSGVREEPSPGDEQLDQLLFERQPNQTYVGNGLCAVPQKIACNFLISQGNNIELPCGNLILFQNHGTTHRSFPTRNRMVCSLNNNLSSYFVDEKIVSYGFEESLLHNCNRLRLLIWDITACPAPGTGLPRRQRG